MQHFSVPGPELGVENPEMTQPSILSSGPCKLERERSYIDGDPCVRRRALRR